MVDLVTSQTLVDGAKNVVMKFTSVSDGTGESAVTKVDVSALKGAPSTVKINKIHYSTSGMIVRMLWDATADVTIMELQGEGCFDATGFGGLWNNAGAGATGDIQFTTIGHTNLDSYVIILEMQKS